MFTTSHRTTCRRLIACLLAALAAVVMGGCHAASSMKLRYTQHTTETLSSRQSQTDAVAVAFRLDEHAIGDNSIAAVTEP